MMYGIKYWIVSVLLLFALLLQGQVVAENNCDTVKDGLIACYPFEGNALDSSGNGNDGTINGATLTTDRFGNLNGAYSFDGVNDYLSLPNMVSGDFSVVFWVKTAKEAPSVTNWFEGWGLVDAEICGVANEWGLALIDGGKVGFGIGNPDNTIKSISLVNDSSWHSVVGTRNQNSGTFQLYVDGALQSTGKGNKNLLQVAPWIGVGNNPCDVSANRRWFDGVVDDVRIYNRTLSDAEIQQLSPVKDTSITQPTSLGCFKDESTRDLSVLSWEGSGMTTERCMASCQGFTYASTQYGRFCFCGDSYGKYGAANNCDTSCSGNFGQICGGFWANSVYEVQTVALPSTDTAYLGCFKDESARDLSVLSWEGKGMTTERCMASCQGFTYASTQYGRYCFCGNSYGKYGAASNCDMSCSGNSEKICGGFWANSVYKIKSTTPIPDLTHTLFPCPCPSVGPARAVDDPARAVDDTGKTVSTETKHEAGIFVNDQPPVTQVKQKLSDTVNVVGNIIVDPVDIGQSVDIFVYAAATFPGSSVVSYYMLGPGLTILAWDQQPANLVAFSSGTLGALQVVSMYNGTFFYPGTLKVFFGYRLPNGVVITSSSPIDITILEF